MEKEQKPKATQKEFEDVMFINCEVENHSVVSAKKNGKWGLVKTYTGESVTGFLYDFIPPVLGSVTPVTKNNKWGYIKINGELLTSVEYDEIFTTPIDYDKIFVEDGIIYRDLIVSKDFATPIDYNRIYMNYGPIFMNGISVFKKDGRYGVTDGLAISKPVFDEIDVVVEDTFISGTRDGIRGYIDKDGEFTADEERAYWIAYSS